MPRKKKDDIINIDGLKDIEAYTHEYTQRTNNPPVGLAHKDKEPDTRKTYEFDPHLEPTLQWAGKAEGVSFEIPTSSIHIHESIKPHKILGSVSKIEKSDGYFQMSLFETPYERMQRRNREVQFYQHGVDWTNRLIAGDSLVIMNSLLEKEGMAGQVQMVYIDPPYGIKYGSNFQPFVDDTSLKSADRDQDLTQEPEMITAFRDTWELGIHSYLSYLRNRLLLAHELLSDSGSVFIQISDENVHLIRCLCDEVFGVENFVSQVSVKKGSLIFAKKLLNSAIFYIIWYAKNKENIKFRPLFSQRDAQDFADTHGSHLWVENCLNDESIRVNPRQRADIDTFLKQNPNCRLFGTLNSNAQGSEKREGYEYQEKIYFPPSGTQWKMSYPNGLDKLRDSNRLQIEGDTLRVKLYYDDYPISRMNNLWTGIGAVNKKLYVVQTATELPSRCMLMTTDPGDLVLDITCGSGTTAYVAEQWGRRWITCDTSRVAIALAKKRLMTATYAYYKLAHDEEGVKGGFVYKTVPHITLKSIANNEPSATETLYDQPEVDKSKIRVSGPFTVEALPAPTFAAGEVHSLNEVTALTNDITSKQIDWRDKLQSAGIIGRGGNRIRFSRVELLQGTKYLAAEAETIEDKPRRAVVCFAPETKPLDSRMVELALDEAENQRPKPQMIIFAAFQFDPMAQSQITDTNWSGVELFQVQMNTDLMTEDLKKKSNTEQAFWLVGQPDVELIKIEKGKDKGKFQVKVHGFDYYDVVKGEMSDSGSVNRIAMWMLDTNYDGLSVEPEQIFFPLDGNSGGWTKLAKTLKAEINQDLIEVYTGSISLPFAIVESKNIAVKIVDDRGIESLKVLRIEEEQ